jgi:hypothetical protein
VKLTVHRADLLGPLADVAGKTLTDRTDCFFITITNASHERDIVVTHVWMATDPPVQIDDPARWEISGSNNVAASSSDVEAAVGTVVQAS